MKIGIYIIPADTTNIDEQFELHSIKFKSDHDKLSGQIYLHDSSDGFRIDTSRAYKVKPFNLLLNLSPHNGVDNFIEFTTNQVMP